MQSGQGSFFLADGAAGDRKAGRDAMTRESAGRVDETEPRERRDIPLVPYPMLQIPAGRVHLRDDRKKDGMGGRGGFVPAGAGAGDARALRRDRSAGGAVRIVGGKLPNPWGLYDMLGNFREWCWDVYDAQVYGAYRFFSRRQWGGRGERLRGDGPPPEPSDVSDRRSRLQTGQVPAGIGVRRCYIHLTMERSRRAPAFHTLSKALKTCR
ncbi:SUMF1/EgtB/PvdO family nonheme iron enzyme [Cohnella ginsengisoli]|uniref:SUMF1/EgtB/PvdO family nonheme iron enzyme n=1 Tax=Cohnella ginsengisoli TaxID=425004 RepID=UPI003B8A7C7D